MLGIGVARAGIALTTFAVANPWVAGLVAAVGVVGALTNGFGLLGDSLGRVRTQADAAQERIARLQNPGSQASWADWESLPVEMRTAIDSSRNPHQTLDIMRNSLRSQIDRHMSQNPGGMRSSLERFFQNTPQPGMLLTPFPSRDDLQRHLQEGQRYRDSVANIMQRHGVPLDEANERARQSLANSRDVRNDAESRRSVLDELTQIPHIAQLESQIRVIDNVARYGRPGLFEGMATGRPTQARNYGGGEQYYGDILQQVLGRSAIEQRNFEIQMQNDRDMLTEMRRLNQNMGNVANPPPGQRAP
jgi:hypothetical protein